MNVKMKLHFRKRDLTNIQKFDKLKMIYDIANDIVCEHN